MSLVINNVTKEHKIYTDMVGLAKEMKIWAFFWLHSVLGKCTNFIVNDEKWYWEIDSALSIGVHGLESYRVNLFWKVSLHLVGFNHGTINSLVSLLLLVKGHHRMKFEIE
jgi:hypothetical protein